MLNILTEAQHASSVYFLEIWFGRVKSSATLNQKGALRLLTNTIIQWEMQHYDLK